MSRQLVMVPPHYEHPRIVVDRWNGPRIVCKPIFPVLYSVKLAEWEADRDRVKRGDVEKYEKLMYPTFERWLEENEPPQKEWYLQWTVEEATWFQLWQTVSEGSPVTPAYETKEELIEYLVRYGDGIYDEEPRWRPWERKYAEEFINGSGWKPSGSFVAR
jgi:hypothetical protein